MGPVVGGQDGLSFDTKAGLMQVEDQTVGAKAIIAAVASSDAAIETADVALMADDLSKLSG